MEPFLSVYGHVAIDQILRVREFPKDNTSVDVIDKSTHLGGTGSNIAVVASRLGVPTALCAFVGMDFPKKFDDIISDAGVITDEFLKVEGFDTSQALVANDDNLTQKVLFYQGPQGFASKTGIILDKNASRSKHIHFCTGEPQYYIDIMKGLKGTVAIDPAQEVHRIWNEDYLKDAMQYSKYLFCNRYEFESVRKYLKIDDIGEVDLPLAVCTCGSEGSIAVIDGERFNIPVVKADRVVDATGAGDSYRAGFYAGLYHGYDIHESLVIASSVSSFIVEEYGSMTASPTWDDVLERADHYMREI